MTCIPSNSKNNDPSSYRVVFASGAHIGVPFLQAIHNDPRFDLVGVMTMPDAKQGRGHKVKENTIAQAALQLSPSPNEGNEVEGMVGRGARGEGFILKPHSLRLTSKKHADEALETKERLEGLNPDFLIVVAYGHLIPQHILDIPTIAPINVHGSLLPAYRGASPLQSVFTNQEKESGITIMRMEAGLDTGPMLSKLKTQLPLDWTVLHLITWIEQYGPTHMLDTCRDYAKGVVTEQPQDNAFATHCGKIQKTDGHIDPYTQTLADIYATYQGYALRPKIYMHYGPQDNKRAIIESIQVDKNTRSQRKDSPLLGLFGNPVSTLSRLNPAITQLQIKPEGKKTISREEFEGNFLTK